MDSDSSDVDVVLAYIIYTKNVNKNAILKSSNARFVIPSPRLHTFNRRRRHAMAVDGRNARVMAAQ